VFEIPLLLKHSSPGSRGRIDRFDCQRRRKGVFAEQSVQPFAQAAFAIGMALANSASRLASREVWGVLNGRTFAFVFGCAHFAARVAVQ
jgi:hypothetical protein